MHSKENYMAFLSAGFGLTLAILVTFQVYLWREPVRIQRDQVRDLTLAVQAGKVLYEENCDSCHGESGGGGVGPALNAQNFLAMVADDSISSLIRTGVPGTLMPAWGQAFGGPLTDEQVSQLAAFIRAWEPTAPTIEPISEQLDPARGAAIYAQTCIICHGESGLGSKRAPALNNPERLASLDNSWYRNTIAHGRPAKGMPTWGTVLSPAQINDLVALIAAWREGRTVIPSITLATTVTSALFALREFDRPDAIFYLKQAQAIASPNQISSLQAIITLIEENHLFEAQSLLISFLPPEEMGRAGFDTNCTACHGPDGTGGVGPNLRGNAFIQAKSDDELVDFILSGRAGTAMVGFEGVLGSDELANVVVLLREWQM